MSTSVSHRLQSAGGSLVRRLPASSDVLAVPPPGSGLAPVRGAFGPPLVGYTFNVQTDLVGLSREQLARYGEVSWLGAVGKKWAFVLGPEAFDEVLTNREKAFANKGWEHLIAPFFARGIMLLDFDEHLLHRRIMQQAFGRQQLIGYAELMDRAIARRMETWQPSPDFALFEAIKQLSLDVAGEVFLGVHLREEVDLIAGAFVDSVNGCQAILRADVPGGAWHRGLRARRFLEDWFREKIPARREGDGNDLFSQLCRAESEDGERFSTEDVINHMIFVLLAAHDTSTITTTMAAYHLGSDLAWRSRARAESLELGTPTIGYEDLERLPVLDQVMRETLRMYAPVGLMVREAVRDTSIRGHFIPAGTPILVGVHPTMRMEPWWHDPDTFDPGRFDEDRREDKSHRLAWMPFGAGAHKCIGMYFGGMEVKAVLHRMLFDFDWDVPLGYTPAMNFGTGPQPADGLPVHIERRSAS